MISPSNTELTAYLAQTRTLVNEALDRTLPAADTVPATLHTALRHAILSPGKRLRGIVVLATVEMLRGSREHGLPLACTAWI